MTLSHGKKYRNMYYCTVYVYYCISWSLNQCQYLFLESFMNILSQVNHRLESLLIYIQTYCIGIKLSSLTQSLHSTPLNHDNTYPKTTNLHVYLLCLISCHTSILEKNIKIYVLFSTLLPITMRNSYGTHYK